MTKLISKNDPQWFAQTSDIPYDRHRYRINYTTGDSVEFDTWDQMNAHWFQSLPNVLKNVEVIDIKKTTNNPKGF